MKALCSKVSSIFSQNSSTRVELIIENTSKHHLTVTLRKASETIRNDIPFHSPVLASDIELFRWYFEDYLSFPFGAEDYRARKAVERLSSLGSELFSLIINPDRSRKEKRILKTLLQCYQKTEVQIISHDPAFNSLPWELLRSAEMGFLSLTTKKLYRIARNDNSGSSNNSNKREDILIIIPRPIDAPYITYDEESYHIVSCLLGLPLGKIFVLRPPTWKALCDFLTLHPSIGVVHFDGHGVAEDEGGYLLFEDDRYQSDPISSHELGQLLANYKIGLFFANACESAKSGTMDPFASVAHQLLTNGVKAVLAMPYSVYASSIATFVEQFYKELAMENSITEAASSARKYMAQNPMRMSALGRIEVVDWPIPIISVSGQDVHLFTKADLDSQSISNGLADDALIFGIPYEDESSLIGRGKELLFLERIFLEPTSPVVLLKGISGVGKTHLAKRFARWYVRTQGAVDGVHYFDYEQQSSLRGIMISFLGEEFLPEEKMVEMTIKQMALKDCLIVLDHCELLFEQAAEKEILNRLIEGIKGGRSRILLVASDFPNNELPGIPVLQLTGLSPQYSASLAFAIFKERRIDTIGFRDNSTFRTLLAQLNGHPETIKAIIPLLEETTVENLYSQLMDRKLSSSTELMFELPFEKMSAITKRHLPFLCFFHRFVDLNSFEIFSSSDINAGSIYEEIFGKVPEHNEWVSILTEAAKFGFVNRINEYFYELHPNISKFLREKIESYCSDQILRRLESQLVQFYCSWADHYRNQMLAGDKIALGLLAMDQFTLQYVIRLAVKLSLWQECQLLLQFLNEYYSIVQSHWKIQPILSFIESKISGVKNEDPAFLNLNLYLSYITDQDDFPSSVSLSKDDPRLASLHVRRGVRWREKGNYTQCEIELQAAYEIVKNHRTELTANVLHELGRTAEELRRLPEAEKLFLEAAQMNESLNLERLAAGDYHHLGVIAYLKGDKSNAKKYLKLASNIVSKLGLSHERHPVLHMLGLIAHQEGKLDEAEALHRKALEIRELLQLQDYVGKSCYQLGLIAHEKNELGYSESWFRRSLQIAEDVRNFPLKILSLYEIARIFLDREATDEAQTYLSLAIEVGENSTFRAEAVPAYHLRSQIYFKTNQTEESIKDLLSTIQYSKLPEHFPAVMDAHYRLGVFFALKKSWKEALYHFAESYALGKKSMNKEAIKENIKCLIGIVQTVGAQEFDRLWSEIRPNDYETYEMLVEDVKGRIIDKSL